MFEVGQLAVYPAHGVGVIEAIEKKVVGGQVHNFYFLRVMENDMVIMVPTTNAEQVGLRPVISPKEVENVYSILRDHNVVIEVQTWNRRYRDYMKKIKTGSIFEVAQVLRDLFLLRLSKELSFGERKMLDTARNLLVKEISIVCEITEASIKQKLESFF